MKFAPASLAIGLLVGFASTLLAQTAPVISGAVPSGAAGTTQISSTAAARSGTKPGANPDEEKTYDDDDALYRGKTSELETTMLRDEGPLHFKKRPKEKVQEINSLKNLPNSPTDRNFEGSLLHSSVTSIEDIVPNKNEEVAAQADDVDSRFDKKELKFVPEKSEKPKKAEADTTPSPTPSATASAKTKDSSGKEE